MSIPSSSAFGRRDAEQLARHQPLLDLAALRRRVARAVRRQPRGHRRLDPLGREAVDQLDRLAALREADRPQPVRDEVGQQARGVAERAGADAELGVDQLRVPERDRPLRRRRGVAVDHRRRLAEQRLGQLRRVRDRRRGEHELRLRAVDAGQPAQAPQDVADVRAEDAAVDVRLVDDDEAEVREHVAPAVVVRQHADVEHVRVGQDDVRPLADLPAPLALGVAVVDRRLHALDAEGLQRAGLILRERLRRVEVERPALRLAREQVEHGQVEREALPARRARRDDHVAAGAERLPGLGLVGVERGDPLRDERRRDARVEVVRKRLAASRRGGSTDEVRELLTDQDLLPGWCNGRHDAYASLRRTGVPRAGLRSHPSNLIRVRPAKGAEIGSTRTDDRDVRLGRRSRHPGRSEGVRRRRLHGTSALVALTAQNTTSRSPPCTSCRPTSSARSSTRSSTTSASTRRRPGCSSRARSSRRSRSSSSGTPSRSSSTRC